VPYVFTYEEITSLIGTEAMIEVVLKAEENLMNSGIQFPVVSSWKDPDVLKRLKKLAK